MSAMRFRMPWSGWKSSRQKLEMELPVRLPQMTTCVLSFEPV
jgi:hypothetical protein